MSKKKDEAAKGKNEATKDETGKSGDPMLNQTLVTGNPVSFQTSKPGNQNDYEPGQPVRESNDPEGHAGNKGPY
ncbi:MAG TPA: hypothetical protein VIL69_24975 [Roseomonas sp.]|jgi:hypothetical protein